MNTPIIRLVCGDCLRSVEISADGVSQPPDVCPYCGGPFENTPDHMDCPGSGLGSAVSIELSPDDPTPQAETIEHGTGAQIGRFQLRESLGGGGSGHVHRAYDPRLDRDVALKVLKEPRPGARVMERFFREARAAARLDHPNIVALHDAGRDNGRCWIAYQYVPGQTLARLAEQNDLAFDECVRIVRALADALDHAHKRGVYHRDLKPSNVIMDQSGQPRLTDFGLARRVDFESTLTREGTILGTPAYMSPEQAQGRSHLYSLGVILYELLSGQRPADLPSSVPVWRTSQAPPAPHLRTIDSAIPFALDRICQRALAHAPEDRYPDARSMAYDLDRWLGRRPRLRRLQGLVGAVALMVLCGVALVAADLPGRSPNRGTAATPAVALVPGPGPAARASMPTVPPAPESQADSSPAASTPPRAAAPPPPVQAAGAPFVGNRVSRVYHLEGCPSLVRMRDSHRITFATAEEAQALGYSPCSRCTPASSLRPTAPHSDGGS